jgi:hypothetical protein
VSVVIVRRRGEPGDAQAVGHVDGADALEDALAQVVVLCGQAVLLSLLELMHAHVQVLQKQHQQKYTSERLEKDGEAPNTKHPKLTLHSSDLRTSAFSNSVKAEALSFMCFFRSRLRLSHFCCRWFISPTCGIINMKVRESNDMET